MNFTDYSLQKLAQGYLLQSSRDAEARHLASISFAGSVKAQRRSQFGLLLHSWLRLTGLLVRYPMNPARVSSLLVAVGFPSGVRSRGV